MGNGTMETARSHSVTTQRVGPDEAESPGGADSAQQSCGRRPRGDGRVTALSSCLLPDPCGFPESQLCPAGRPSTSFRGGRCAADSPGRWGSTEYYLLCGKRGRQLKVSDRVFRPKGTPRLFQ